MIGVPMNPNAVYVSMIQTGCYKAEFDSTYPIHLNGIIGQHEFQESIEKINRIAYSSSTKRYMTIIYLVSAVVSIAFLILGAMSVTSSRSYGFPPLIAVGIVISILSSILYITIMVVIQMRQATRLRQAIAAESMKYSVRSPTPCSWRLESSSNYFGGYNNFNSYRFQHLVIEVGRSTSPASGAIYSNQKAYETSYLLGQQNQYGLPPYSSSSGATCSQCGAARRDSSARFCSSCGQAFDKS